MAVNEGDGDGIDINRLESSINDMMPHDLLMLPNCCIFKTPTILKRHNEKAFIPDAFSIGPVHHGDQNLKATEKIKAKYLQGLISRSDSPDTMVRTMVSSIMEVEKEAREYYAEAIDYNPEQLVQILVIDGCFLIELFRKAEDRELIDEDDPIFTQSCMFQFLNHDLILLENQVPWMILEILFDLTQDFSPDLSLIQVATLFLQNSLLPKVSETWFTTNVQSINNIEGIKHFVDLDRKLSILSYEVQQESIGEWELLPSATSLVESGIKFKRGTSRSILDIKFIDGVLEIPPLVINDVTETIIRNLISYEQCLPNCEQRITSYVIFLDSLINTAGDMDILCMNKIIDNWLNPEDTAKLFNKLYHDTYVNHNYYANIGKKVNSFCQRKWPRWRSVLVRDYVIPPWAVVSALVAGILFLMSFLQTWYSMKK